MKQVVPPVAPQRPGGVLHALAAPRASAGGKTPSGATSVPWEPAEIQTCMWGCIDFSPVYGLK